MKVESGTFDELVERLLEEGVKYLTFHPVTDECYSWSETKPRLREDHAGHFWSSSEGLDDFITPLDGLGDTDRVYYMDNAVDLYELRCKYEL